MAGRHPVAAIVENSPHQNGGRVRDVHMPFQALIFVTQSRTASFNSAKEKKRLLRSLPSTKRETMPTAASTLALAKAVKCSWCGNDHAPKGPYHAPLSSPPRSQG